MESQPAPASAVRAKRNLLRLAALLAVLIAAGAGYLAFNGFGGPGRTSPSASYSKKTPRLPEESLRKIPDIFPRQFILGKAPQVVNVAEKKEDSLAIVNLEFRDAENTAAALVKEYEEYAPKAYWSLQKAETRSGGFALRFKRGFQEMTASIEPDPAGGILVKMDYRVRISPAPQSGP
jgi:hypothetical protein